MNVKASTSVPRSALPAGVTDDTSVSLLKRVRGGEQDAWERLVRLYGPLVWHWCRRSDLPPEDASDVFQEVFSSVHVGLPSFRRDQASQTFRGWLRTIARNTICDHFRRRSRQIVTSSGDFADTYLQNAEASSEWESSTEAMLSERSSLLRQALMLIRCDFEPHVWEAFLRMTQTTASSAEVGDELGMTAAAVRQAKTRVVRRLRQEFTELIEFPASISQPDQD